MSFLELLKLESYVKNDKRKPVCVDRLAGGKAMVGTDFEYMVKRKFRIHGWDF